MKLVIDVSNCFHKSYSIIAGYAGFNVWEKKWQNMFVRKFITDLLSIISRFENNKKHVILCFDSDNYFRKAISADYKGTRTKKEQPFYDCLNEIETVLNRCESFNCIKLDGLEADDLLALSSEFIEDFCILVSNDEDIRQLADEKTVIYTANTTNLKVFCSKESVVLGNIPNFRNISEIVDPEKIFYKKLLLGCTGDNVERILPKGNGEKKVEQIYLNYIQKHEFRFVTHDVRKSNLIDLINVLSEFGFEIGLDRIVKQLKMVGLGSKFVPFEVDKNLFNTSNSFKEITLQNLLKNTSYGLGNI